MTTKVQVYKLSDKDFTPRSPAQKLFFKRDLEGVYDICFGGSAYGGKTLCMLISSLLYVDNPQYRAAFFRREQSQLENSGLMDEAEKWYSQIYPGVVYNKTLKLFTFPSGARIRFHGCEGQQDFNKFKGAEWHALYIEEATQFSEDMIGFLSSRVRNPKGKIPLRIRMSTNPGDIHEEHIMQKYMPWIYNNCASPQDPPIKAKDAQVLYFYANDDYEIELKEEKPPGKHGEDYFTSCFIRTRTGDLGDGQQQRLAINIKDPIIRMQQLDGIWGLRPEGGMYFSETDFKQVDDKPKVASRIRYWDKACAGRRGDWLAGLLLARTTNDTYIIEDVVLTKAEVHQVKNIIYRTAHNDGKKVVIAIEQEGGSSGKETSYEYEKMFMKEGFQVLIDVKTANKNTSSKLQRAAIVSPIVKEGRVALLSGGLSWKTEFMKQLVNFPSKGIHDDCVDCFSGAYYLLSTKIPAPLASEGYNRFMQKLNDALPDNFYGRLGM